MNEGEKSKKNNNGIHVVCIPYPAQGHITPMLQLAKLLNSKGFYITFVNTEHNHHCLLTSRGPGSLDGTPTFRFETFPDGLPPSEEGEADLPRPILPLVRSLEGNCCHLLEKLLLKLTEPSSSRPPIGLIISDAILPLSLDQALKFVDCPIVLFTPSSPSSFLGYSQFDTLLDRGILPFRDQDFMTNGSLEVELELEPPSMKGMRLRDLPSQIRTAQNDNPVFSYMRRVMEKCRQCPMIFNTFEALDHEVLRDLSKGVLGPIYTIGPLHSLSKDLITDLGSNIWKEDSTCLQWLDGKEPNSVVYASFGSSTVMTNEQLTEFAWGLANSNHPFLWVVRPDIIVGESSILTLEFVNEVKGRGLLVSWSPQEKVLNHPSIGVYLMHSGWNSTLEAITNGVPVICWPYKGDHQPISWWSSYKWGFGMELDIFAKRAQIGNKIREVLEKDIGNKIRRKAIEWKKLAEEATTLSGSSTLEIHRFINYVLSLNHDKNGTKIV